jgi:hypothetical protein
VPEPLKVSVTLTITLANPDDWTIAFGEKGRAAIRDDVKSYVGNLIPESGVFGNGEVEASVDWR